MERGGQSANSNLGGGGGESIYVPKDILFSECFLRKALFNFFYDDTVSSTKL